MEEEKKKKKKKKEEEEDEEEEWRGRQLSCLCLPLSLAIYIYISMLHALEYTEVVGSPLACGPNCVLLGFHQCHAVHPALRRGRVLFVTQFA